MNLEENTKIVNELLENQKVTFTYDNHFIHIQEHSESGYDGSVFNTQKEYDNQEECLDGGVCETIVAVIAVEFFMDIARDLTERGV